MKVIFRGLARNHHARGNPTPVKAFASSLHGVARANEKAIRVGHPGGPVEIGRPRCDGRGDGLALALILILMDPSGIASAVDHGGSQGFTVFVGTLVLSFAIGATLTGVVFMMTDDN